MSKRIDLDKVQAALDRAAKDAVSGPREARAGRFTASESAKQPSRAAPSTQSKRK